MDAKLLEVHAIELTLLKSNPPQLSILAFGSASSLGWKGIKLIPFVYLVPPKDGIYEFDLIGTPPSDNVGQQVTPVVAHYVIENMPDGLTGVRIYASLNNLEKTLGTATNLKFGPIHPAGGNGDDKPNA